MRRAPDLAYRVASAAIRLSHEKIFRTFHLNKLAMPLSVQTVRLRTGAFVKDTNNVIALGPTVVGKNRPLYS